VVSRTGTNFVRFAVAALLGVAACLVAWWPQSAAGSGETGTFSAAAAAPTQKTPTPTKTPTATVAPTTAAPPPPPPPPASPTHKPTKKPTHKPTHKPTTLHNGGGSHPGSGGSTPKPPPKPTHSTGSSGSTSAPYTPPAAPITTSPAKPTNKPTASAPTSAPTSAAVAPTPTTPTAKPDKNKGDEGADEAETYDTYLTSSEPVETKSAPVWVVPGILLVLTSMLALLGGVLGRGTRPAVARVKPSDDASDD
jgi:hypothetical protein